MPRLYRVGSLIIYIWTSEGYPTESVHVHISRNKQSEYLDKFWLSKYGYFIADKNNKLIDSRLAHQALESFIRDDGMRILLAEWIRLFGQDSIRFIDQ